MKHIIITFLSIVLFLPIFTFSQNVGIGTTLPDMALHIRTTDTNVLSVQNAIPLAAGVNTGLYLRAGNYYTGAIKTTGTSASEARLGIYTFSVTNANAQGLKERISILDNGYVGINTITPQAQLDVNGTLLIRGGSPGEGKVLTSNAMGQASWQVPVSTACFSNLAEINFGNSTSLNWIVPPGVTKILVEMWGQGGRGTVYSLNNTQSGVGGGGGGGAFARFFLDVLPGSTATLSKSEDPDLGFIKFTYNGDFVTTYKGGNGISTSTPGDGGIVIRGGVSWSNNIFYVFGEDGQENSFETISDELGNKQTNFKGGRGGNSYQNYGSRGETWVIFGAVQYSLGLMKTILGKQPNYGAGSGARVGHNSTANNPAGRGGILIYY